MVQVLAAAGQPDAPIELVRVPISSDIDLSTPISEMSGQGVFVTEVQAAVLDGRADLAVHSAKDMRSESTAGLVFGGCLERGDVCDAIIGQTLNQIRHGGIVATGSQRRQCQLADLRPDLHFVGLRGNMARRIAAADRPDVDAVVVAAVALERLGESHRIAQRFDPHEFVPQAGQGAIAIEHREGDTAAACAVAKIIDHPTSRCVAAERAFLRTLGGGCDLPTGAYATIDDDQNVQMTALLAAPDGVVERAVGVAIDGEALGIALARELLERTGTADA